MSLLEAVRCPACGADNPPAARYCNRCTAALMTVRAPTAAGAERKHVTVLFSDLTGFTAMSERLDPEETREIMSEVFGRAAEIIGRYDGRIEKFIGDAIMAIFGVPVAHEDDPVRAVRAALEMHEAVAQLSPRVEARVGAPIALHSGVNTGLVVTGELQFDRGTAGPLGDTINLAARLMNAAPSGEIWVGPETRRLVARAYELEDLGAREFKGKTEPVAVARVLGAPSRDAAWSHFRGTFVGRQAELDALLGAAERMRAGEPAVVGVRGDAGTGKTRLVREFRVSVGADVQWLEGYAYPYAQNIPYAPVIDLLSRSWGIEERDSPATVRRKIESALSTLLGAPGEMLPLVLHLYHLEQDAGVVIEREAFQGRLLDGIRQLLAALAKLGPTVICLQDLHWADHSSAILLHGLCEGLQMPVLLLANFRPGFVPPARMQLLELRELSSRQTSELLASLLKAEPPAALTRFIQERSDGNPFYVEEVVNSLVESRVLVRAGQGWELARPLSEVGVPATVRGVIAARIDRLDELRRRVLRHAAVVGREFLYAIVAQVMPDTPELAPSLSALQAADLIRARRAEPELEYIFKHALTQEVAYDGLLKSERQRLHERAAHAMEAVLAGRIPEFVETLAYHFQRAGAVEKAVHYLGEAGRKCVARYALAEAAIHFREAYALISEKERTPQQSAVLARLLVSWAQVHYYEGAVGEWRRLLEKHLVDAERCGDPALHALYLGWLGLVRAMHGDPRGSLESLEAALQIGRSARARDAVAYTLAWYTLTLFDSGRIAEAIAAGESLVQSDEEKLRDPYPHFKSRMALAVALTFSGDLRKGRETAARLVAFGRAIGNARAESLGHFGLAMHWIAALDFERAAAAGQEGIAAAKDPLYAAASVVPKALALLADLQVEAGARLCAQWLPYLEQNENYWFGHLLKGVRAGTALGLGQLSTGMRDILEGIEDLYDRGMVATALFSETFLLLTYVSIARMDLKPTLGAILRNPWFVFTQAPWAARKARGLIDRLRAQAEQNDLRGLHGLIDLGEGRLLVHQGRKAQARQALERIRHRLDAAGVEREGAAVGALAAEIGR